jgi:exopolyphosphatase/guanosine-5'-triphosphate,3'-diphosphate pyrophosphatase
MNEEFILGTKILRNLMKQIEALQVNYLPVVEEFIEARTSHIFRLIRNKKIRHYLVVGGEVAQMKSMLFGGRAQVSREDFEALYQDIITDHRELRSRVEDLGVDWYELMATVLVNHTFLSLVKTQALALSDINLRDGIIAELIEKDHSLNRYRIFNEDMIFLATSIAKRYKTSLPHAKWIRKNSLVIYREMKRHYPFEERDEVILQLSALLHEIGKFTRMKDYMNTSFSKVKNLSILGMTEEEMRLVASVCLVMISPRDFKKNENLLLVREDQMNRIFKLGAILTLADSLDKSKRQKITLLKVALVEGDLKLEARAREDATLENWDYEQKRRFFINTYGIHPRLEYR